MGKRTVVIEAVTSDRRERHRIIDDGQGMGGYASPPGHVNLRYSYEVDVKRRNRWDEDAYMQIKYAAEGENVPEEVRAKAAELIAAQKLVCSEAWMGHVYHHYQRCYYPAGVINRERSANTGEPEHHGGYLTVKQYFPDHEPRLDLIASGGHPATWECRHCGRRVQYEPRIDGFSVYDERSAACIRDEPHEPIRQDGESHHPKA